MQILEDDGILLPSLMDSAIPPMENMLPHRDRIVEMQDEKLSQAFEELLKNWFRVRNDEPINDYVFKIDLKPGVEPLGQDLGGIQNLTENSLRSGQMSY